MALPPPQSFNKYMPFSTGLCLSIIPTIKDIHLMKRIELEFSIFNIEV